MSTIRKAATTVGLAALAANQLELVAWAASPDHLKKVPDALPVAAYTYAASGTLALGTMDTTVDEIRSILASYGLDEQTQRGGPDGKSSA